jgi:hypothetical protein
MKASLKNTAFYDLLHKSEEGEAFVDLDYYNPHSAGLSAK